MSFAAVGSFPVTAPARARPAPVKSTAEAKRQAVGWEEMVSRINHRNKCIKIVSVLLPVLVITSFNAEILFSEILSDTVILAGSWDFSEQCSKSYPERGDVCIVIVVDPPPEQILVLCEAGAKVCHLPDSTFNDLKYAPEDTLAYDYYSPFVENSTYVIRTGDAKYAKIRFTQLYPYPMMEYAYQTDGSRMLFSPVAVESVSWGTIKKVKSL